MTTPDLTSSQPFTPEIEALVTQAQTLFKTLDTLTLEQKILALNELRRVLHVHSPFSSEPVDYVQWVPAEEVSANDYNPNSVAPPEMALLTLSIDADGFTQPIVTHEETNGRIVVDGFHRQLVGRQPGNTRERLHGYLPVVSIRADRGATTDRIAATIRHNRARGVHGVMPMTDIVVALLQQDWNDEDVARELGMDADEVLRFKQISGLPELFADYPYSRGWE